MADTPRACSPSHNVIYMLPTCGTHSNGRKPRAVDILQANGQGSEMTVNRYIFWKLDQAARLLVHVMLSVLPCSNWTSRAILPLNIETATQLILSKDTSREPLSNRWPKPPTQLLSAFGLGLLFRFERIRDFSHVYLTLHHFLFDCLNFEFTLMRC